MKKVLNTSIVIVAFLILLFFYMGLTSEPTYTKVAENAIIEKERVFKSDKDYSKNIVGYLRIPNIDFDVAVTQYNNNTYYLNHDIDGNKKAKGNPFLDYRDKIEESKVLRIYGHNSNTIKTEFRPLENYYNESYYKDNKYIFLESENKLRKYQIFSVYVETNDWSYYNVDLTNPDIYQKELEKYKRNSWYDTKVEVDKNDNILLLQTCSYLNKYKKFNNKYVLIFAKEVNM